jgi:hypothetical protein
MRKCTWLDESTRSGLEARLEDYFLGEVDDVKSFAIERGYRCERELVVPIAACVGDSPLSQTWVVYISKEDAADINLERPE